MADLKVKLQFNDENATSFEYDKLNGLKSLSFLNQSKTDDESIDYSVKSNTGSLSVVDKSKPKSYADEFFNGFKLINVEKEIYYYAQFRGIYYSEEDDLFYIANDGDAEFIYKTKDFNSFEQIKFTYENRKTCRIDGIIKFNNCIIGTGLVYIDGKYKFGYIYYDGTSTTVVPVGTFESSAIPGERPFTRCIKVINNKLFVSLGHYYYEMTNFYIDTIGGEIHNISIPFSYTTNYKSLFDVIFVDGTYIFLSNYGLFSSTDLVNFKSLYSLDVGIYGDRGSIIYDNGTYYFTSQVKGIYKTQDLKNFELINLSNLRHLINISKIDDMFLLCSENEIYYTSDFTDATTISLGLYFNEFSGIAVSPKYVGISTASYNFTDSYIICSGEKLRKLVVYKSLYDYLLKKPKYDKIYVNIALDSNYLGLFINSGKIEYDNDTRELNLNFQNNIVLLQNKKYKMQIDKYRIGSTTLLDILNELISLASGLIGQEFEIDSVTQTYLGSVNVQYPYLEEASVWEQLNKLCVAGQLSIYPSGTKIKVERWV